MAFTSASKAGMRARITLLVGLIYATTTLQLEMIKVQRSKYSEAESHVTHRVSFQAIMSGMGKQGAGSHSPCTLPPTCHHKTTPAVPISKPPQSTKEISGEIPPFFMQPLLQNGVFFQVKARAQPVCLTLKLRGHFAS